MRIRFSANLAWSRTHCICICMRWRHYAEVGDWSIERREILRISSSAYANSERASAAALWTVPFKLYQKSVLIRHHAKLRNKVTMLTRRRGKPTHWRWSGRCWTVKINLWILAFPWLNFNVVWSIKTATTHSTCRLILYQICFVVFLMPILFANSMLSFSQYELKSSEATRFATGWNRCSVNANFFRSIYVSFWSVWNEIIRS